MVNMETNNRARLIPSALTIFLVSFSLLSRTSTSILTPVWLDFENNDTSTDKCDARISDHQIDAFAIMFIATFIFTVVCGTAVLVIKHCSPSLITDEDSSYDKKQFALIGLSDTLSALCFLYASSGCRTAPYLQSLAANFAVPVTFIIRYLVLHKRPTLRKMICAVLVLVAEFTALIPDIFPSIQSKQAKTAEGGADGVAGILWPMCFFFGFVPMALQSVYMEKAVKHSHIVNSSDNAHNTITPTHQSQGNINVAYFLFWTYLFSLLSLTLLFWCDIIPGFGMSNGIVEFAKGFWFNIRCFVGYEGCSGMINVISGGCIVLLLLNRIVNVYFLRHLEGANYLVIINSLQTPLVFLFFTLFDENPVKWHPHVYLSTWLSIVALCIMVPAVYIYDTGPQELVTSQPQIMAYVQDYYHDNECQTEVTGSNDRTTKSPDDPDETSRLLPV